MQQHNRQLEQQLSAQTATALGLQQLSGRQQASLNAIHEAHEQQFQQVKNQHTVDLRCLEQQLASVLAENDILQQHLQQERKSFEASLLSGGSNARHSAWKGKVVALRKELEEVRLERDRLAAQLFR